MSPEAAARSRRTKARGIDTMIRTITVDREFGSGGGVIAAKLAARLGWTLWDQLLTDEIARRMDCDGRDVAEREERSDPTHYRLFKAFLRGSFEGSVNLPRLRLVDADCVREMTQRILLEIGETGSAVIVGRGSAYYLADRKDVFHVFIYGSLARQSEAADLDRQDREGRARVSGDGGSRSRGLHQTLLRSRVALAAFVPLDDQFRYRG